MLKISLVMLMQKTYYYGLPLKCIYNTYTKKAETYQNVAAFFNPYGNTYRTQTEA